jgi:hypothetical protein
MVARRLNRMDVEDEAGDKTDVFSLASQTSNYLMDAG